MPYQLQWGHVNEDVEEKAAIEMRRAKHGLQWGHVNEDVEEADAPALKHTSPWLQWGHVNEDVEERRIRSGRWSPASMGPRQ